MSFTGSAPLSLLFTPGRILQGRQILCFGPEEEEEKAEAEMKEEKEEEEKEEEKKEEEGR